ncbi:MAG: MFS transporter [Thermomicrobiales bacterium]|nr:MFS transporter [Thermomicrobiales bacterium]
MAERLGLSREISYVFWAMIGIEAAYGAYGGIWPLWIEALGAPVSIVGLVLGSAGIFRLLVLAPSATLTERFDPRTLMLVSRCVAAVGLLGAALATHWTQLWVMVIATAIGEIVFPLSQNYLAARAGDHRVRAFTLVFNVGPAVAFALSPLAAGALIAQYGMRAAFFLALAFSLFSIGYFTRFSRRPPRTPHAARESSTYREAFREPGVRLLLTLQFATIFALALGISLLPNFLSDQRGIPAAVVAILGGIGSTGSVVFGLAVARSGRLQRFPLYGVIFASIAAIVTLAVCAAVHWTPAIVVAFLGRGGLWSAWGLFIAALGDIVTVERHRQRVFTLSEMIGGTAFFSAPMLAGLLYSVRPVAPLLVSIALAVALLPVLVVGQRRLSAAHAARERHADEASRNRAVAALSDRPPPVAGDA